MNRRIKNLIWAAAWGCLPIIVYFIAGQPFGDSEQHYSLVKGLAIAFYYVFYYCGKWIAWQQIGILLLVAFMVWKLSVGRRVREFQYGAGFRMLTASAAVAGSFWCAVMRTGSIEANEKCFGFLWCIVMLWLIELTVDGCIWIRTAQLWTESSEEQDRRFIKTGLWIIGLIMFLLVFCVIAGGRYVYPQGDDFEYGAYSHQALEAGEGLMGALSGAVKMVAKSYQIWQGTFSSIFLMALQPGIWGEEYYHLTPFMLLFLLASSLFFFMDSVFRKMLRAEKKEVLFLFFLAAFLMIQLAPAPVSAFYWWNGAIHYTGAMAFLLYMVSFIIRAAAAEKGKASYIAGACITAVMVGGGNLVTALIGCVLIVYILIALGLLKRKDLMKYILIPGIMLAAAFIVNVAAPGNWIRQGQSGELIQYGVIGSIIKSFEICIEYALGEWSDVSWILMILAAMPLLSKMALRCRFSYPLPGFVSLAAFCMLAAMYTPQLYATGEYDTGRIQNIIYDMFVILTLILEFYWLGWIQRKNILLWTNKMIKKWYMTGSVIVFMIFVLTAVAEPERMTSTAVIKAVVSREAQEYAESIYENIQKIKGSSDTELIRIDEPPQKPEIFKSQEIETWRYGTAEYYGKYKIRYYGEEE